MHRPRFTSAGLLYWIAALGSLLVVVSDLIEGNASKIVGSAALLGSFLLLALYPAATERPRWVGWLSMGLVLVALGSLAYRLTRSAA
ncbi:hypothetical protein [Hymenobacter koreensis]|uniref:Uncharacterized protein n=1 Tax=Hymenobacter koreensis TaxID=1084523 RepID=A0ABP8J0R0_9BACT